MNGPQHYAEAEAILQGIDESYGNAEIRAASAHAQAHAALALVAAKVQADQLDSAVWVIGPEWAKAVSES